MNAYNSSCASPCARTGNYSTSEKADTSCACHRPRFPLNTAYAMAYVPFQQSGEVYSCEKALSRGTIFPCLDKPFLKGCCK